MGYTHSFVFQPGSSRYAAAWPSIVADTRRIVRAVRRRSIVISGPEGLNPSVSHPDAGIIFDGDAATGLSCDALRLPIPGPVEQGAPDDCWKWRYTKTQGLPYDLAVTAVLLRCHLPAPEVFRIGSNSAWIPDWTEPEDANPRDLVRELFGFYVDDDPLVDSTEGLAIGPAGLIDPRLVANPVIL